MEITKTNIKYIFRFRLNAMNKHRLYFLIFHVFKNYLPCLKVFNSFLFVRNFWWMRMAQFKPQWKGHKSKIHFRITCCPTNVFSYKAHVIYQIERCHAPESNKVNSEKRTYNSKWFSINIERNKRSVFMSDCTRLMCKGFSILI
jgi:hypothetical protein